MYILNYIVFYIFPGHSLKVPRLGSQAIWRRWPRTAAARQWKNWRGKHSLDNQMIFELNSRWLTIPISCFIRFRKKEVCNHIRLSLLLLFQTTEETRVALEKLVNGKISAAMPVRHAEKQAPAQYIRCVTWF